MQLSKPNDKHVCSKQILHNHAIFCWDKPTTIPYPVATYDLLKHRSGDKRIETIIIGKSFKLSGFQQDRILHSTNSTFQILEIKRIDLIVKMLKPNNACQVLKSYNFVFLKLKNDKCL